MCAGFTRVRVLIHTQFGNDLACVTVALNCKPCSTPKIASAHTQLSVTIPPGSGKDMPLSVLIAGSESNTIMFSYAPPKIANVEPKKLRAGGTITITGENFGPKGGEVHAILNGVLAEVSVVVEHTVLSCHVPTGIGKNLHFVLVVAGATSNDFPLSYDKDAQYTLTEEALEHWQVGALQEAASIFSKVLRYYPDFLPCALGLRHLLYFRPSLRLLPGQQPPLQITCANLETAAKTTPAMLLCEEPSAKTKKAGRKFIDKLCSAGGAAPVRIFLTGVWLQQVEGENVAAADYLGRAADSGSAPAQFLLGVAHFCGDGVVRADPKRGVALLERAVDDGHATAAHLLGAMYYRGSPTAEVAVNKARASQLHACAADAGHVASAHLLAVAYCEGGGVPRDPVRAAQLLQRIIDTADYPPSTLLLGLLNLKGDGVRRDMVYGAQLVQQAADTGDPAALYRLGRCCIKGYGVRADARRAAKLFRRGAESDHVPCTLALAALYRDGAEGVAADPARAASLYRRAAEAGDARGLTALAQCYASGDGVAPDATRSVALLRRAADAGSSEALYRLAESYHDGRGVERDPNQAAALYERASDSGYAPALCGLARCYMRAEGVPADPERAEQLLRRAAYAGNADAAYLLATTRTVDKEERLRLLRYAVESGHARAMVALGAACGDAAEAVSLYQRAADAGAPAAEALPPLAHCYFRGDGVPRDRARAARQFERALQAGAEFDVTELGVCLLEGAGDALEKDEARAVALLQRALDAGHVAAAAPLARCLLSGEGVPAPDPQRATQLLRDAADAGDGAALHALGSCYARGDGGMPHDVVLAASLFERAVDANCVAACYDAGVCYWHGDGVAQDRARAASLWGRGADAGDADSSAALGVCLAESGADDTRAVVLLQRGADAGRAEAAAWLGVLLLRDSPLQDRARGASLLRAAVAAGVALLPEWNYLLGREALAAGDTVEALRLTRLASDAGHSVATFDLAARGDSGASGGPAAEACAQCLIGASLLREGDRAAAAAQFERALSGGRAPYAAALLGALREEDDNAELALRAAALSATDRSLLLLVVGAGAAADAFRVGAWLTAQSQSQAQAFARDVLRVAADAGSAEARRALADGGNGRAVPGVPASV
eukprot:TRINITY_DN4141_c0_g2_i1.p1 TRINITY_DN4141_c0_g2~~TRINITY_DN4141_c0_g2_i1.p1  ORF type:complete len:1134 (+),score=270.28 TRINITY_DN4141_c0_g2_i1:1213-4614(+)